MGLRGRDDRRRRHARGRHPGGRGEPPGQLAGLRLLQQPLQNSRAASQPQRQRRLFRRLLGAPRPLRLGLPQDRHGRDRQPLLPRYFRRGRPVSRPDGGSVRECAGDPDPESRHGAHQGSPVPSAGKGAAGGRTGYPGHLRAQRRGPAGAGGHGAEQGLVRPARRDAAGEDLRGHYGKRYRLHRGL